MQHRPTEDPRVSEKAWRGNELHRIRQSFFTYKYKKTGLVETDAELLMGKTEELLEEMKELVLEKLPAQEN